MRLIVKESQYKSIIREQQSKNKMVNQWSTFIMDKMLLNVPLSTEEIISETQLNRKIYRNNFYKKLPINNITINTIKGKDKNYGFEIELKDDIIENLFLDIQIPYNEEIKLEDIKSIFNSVTNKRFKLLNEQWIKGVDLGDLQGEVASTQGRFKVWFNKELKVIDINDGEIIFDKSNVDDAEWEKITQWAQEAFSKENYPDGGYVTTTTPTSITFDTTPDDQEKDDDNVTITPDENDDNVVITPDENTSVSGGKKIVDIENELLFIPNPNSSPFGMRGKIPKECNKYKRNPRKYPRKKRYCGPHMHYGQDYGARGGAKKGTKVLLFKPGKVIEIGCECLKIKHDDGTKSRYCHLDKKMVGMNDRIEVGTFIGTVGGKGSSCKTVYDIHLHLEYYENGRDRVDPLEFGEKYVRFLPKNEDYENVKI